jgi:hypothetical protein
MKNPTESTVVKKAGRGRCAGKGSTSASSIADAEIDVDSADETSKNFAAGAIVDPVTS